MTGNFYELVGAYSSMVFGTIFSCIIVFRSVLLFRNYINTGGVGDHELCWFGQLFDGKGPFSPCIFYGFHPVGILMDMSFMALFIVLLIPFWPVVYIVALLILLATVMRKRIAHKQEFIANLKGDQLE